MDVRSLKFFLAVAREGSFVKAAESLRLTQPNLSRTIRELENEVGSALFVRSSRGVTLTDSGIVLRKRASEVMELIEKTRSEVASFAATGITGEVRLAAGEAENLRPLIRVMRAVQASHPGISYRIFSGNGEEVTRRIDNGLADFGVVFEPVDITRYDHLKRPGGTAWGVVMPVTAPWAGELAVTPEMLLAMPLLVPEQMLEGNGLSGWLGDREEKRHVKFPTEEIVVG